MKTHVSYQMGDGHNVTGQTPVSYDNFVFEQIEENIVFKKQSIDEHYDHVMSTIGNSYKGANKYVYGNILQAIKAIVNCKKHRLKSPVRKQAIAFLHQETKFSPATIQRILLLFGVKMQTATIIKDSDKVFAEKQAPAWLQRFVGGAI